MNINQKKRIKYLFNKLKVKFGLVKTKLTEPKEDWRNIAQEYEFSFHKTNQFRQSDEFEIETKKLFEGFGFKGNDFIGNKILDLGAGSKMRGRFFIGSKIIIIEPMADRCIKEIPWCDLNEAEKVFSVPGE